MREDGTNPTTDSWTLTSLTNVPAAASTIRAVWSGTEMIVWGGEGPGFLNSGGRYNPSTDTWAATSVSPAPVSRTGHAAVWTGSLMIIWGGSVSSARGTAEPCTTRPRTRGGASPLPASARGASRCGPVAACLAYGSASPAGGRRIVQPGEQLHGPHHLDGGAPRSLRRHRGVDGVEDDRLGWDERVFRSRSSIRAESTIRSRTAGFPRLRSALPHARATPRSGPATS
jgi:hypothetical protein